MYWHEQEEAGLYYVCLYYLVSPDWLGEIDMFTLILKTSYKQQTKQDKMEKRSTYGTNNEEHEVIFVDCPIIEDHGVDFGHVSAID